jgi:hypothetical protein
VLEWSHSYRKLKLQQSLVKARVHPFISLSCVGREGKTLPMIDPDVMTILVLLIAVLVALLMPPGPGTPLRSPVR